MPRWVTHATTTKAPSWDAPTTKAPKPSKVKYGKMVRCCKMSSDDSNIFKKCLEHKEMECNGLEIGDRKTTCHKVDNLHHDYKGICVPKKKKCDSNHDCPQIRDKEKKHLLKTRCIRDDICIYKNKLNHI